MGHYTQPDRMYKEVHGDVTRFVGRYLLPELIKVVGVGHGGSTEPLYPLPKSYSFELHQIRAEGYPDLLGLPVSRGWHQDGGEVSCVFCLHRDNVASDGGITKLASSVKKMSDPEHSLTLQPGHGIVFLDSKVIHTTTPIRPLNPVLTADRGVLVIVLLPYAQ
jgi:hypothetical protein